MKKIKKIIVDRLTYQALAKLLTQAPKPNRRLEKLLATPAPWED
jgi:uncharacterized protein (DUF1778 family)